MMASLLILFLVILVMLIIVSYRIHTITKKEEGHGEREENGGILGWIYTAIVFMSIAIIATLYFMFKGSNLQGHLMEWLNIVVRVMHITFGIAWIGASFYFVFLENALNRKENLRDELAGNLWAVHGGGFYYLEKYKGAPPVLPKSLHWFKYEAYFTWLSGFGLLFIVYYMNASSMLIDPQVKKINEMVAITIGIGSLIAGWIIYDLLCRSALIARKWLFTLIGLIILIAFAYAYSRLFSGRGAFIHFGALLGSIMAGNVFFVIIPSQKAMVRAAKKGIMPNPALGQHALARSIHNNYFTLPVLFVMVSNHFPSTFGNKYQWVVLVAVTVATAGIKHWLNLREQGRLSIWVMPVSIIILFGCCMGYCSCFIKC